MYYLEFYDRRPEVNLEDFHSSSIPNFSEWSRRYPQDELVLNVGRTWRLGPFPYLLAWGCAAFERLLEWDNIFRSEAVDDIEVPLLDVMRTNDAGFYRDCGKPLPRPTHGPFYLETFRPWQGAYESYVKRSNDSGLTLSLLIERIGLLAPAPGGIAVFTLPQLDAMERLAAAPPEQVESVGLYEPTGKEIL